MVEREQRAARGAAVVLVTEPRMGRYAEPAGTPLEAIGDLRRVDWQEGMTEEQRYALFDEALVDADAVIVSPWTWATMPRFTPERWSRANRLKVIAGTFDN